MDWKKQMEEYAALIDDAMVSYLQPQKDSGQEKVFEAARYSANASGKRLRPVLVLEFCRLCGGDLRSALPFACALEMIHTYSLIHDDLPCMDDDDLRRGRPTNHKIYGEAMAVLAGDGLLNLAFETASDPMLLAMVSPQTQLHAIRTLSRASGMEGMIGGQVLDMQAENHAVSLEELKTLQSLKTGALISAAAALGCMIGGADESQFAAGQEYARALGLAFQIQDDILDIKGDEAVLGKPIGSDAEKQKSTYPSLLGVQECRRMVQELSQQAVDALDSAFTESGILVPLAWSLAQRVR